MKTMTERQIERAISNVNATLAVEGLKPSRFTVGYGKRYFRDEISIDEAIKLTTRRILIKKERLIESWHFQNMSVKNLFNQFIKENLDKCLEELKCEDYLVGKNVNDFSNRLAYYMAELNYIHPFREGNGRALREFIRCLSLKFCENTNLMKRLAKWIKFYIVIAMN